MDPAKLDEIEDALIRADLGFDLAASRHHGDQPGRYSQGITPDEVKAVVAAEVAKILAPVAKPLVIGDAKPFVILVAGVNGSGKTTTIGKLAAKLSRRGPQGGARRRRHLPRRRHRAAQDLGRAHRRQGDRARAGRRFGEPRLRGAERGARPRAPTC